MLSFGVLSESDAPAVQSLLESNPEPTDAEIVAGMDRNVCRCCSYPRIVMAVRRAVALAGEAAR